MNARTPSSQDHTVEEFANSASHKSALPRFGKLAPMYSFALNPYDDARFSRCPNCGERTKLRKVPLFVHIDPLIPMVINKTTRYCTACDLLIVHRDELEAVLCHLLPDRSPETIRTHYLVLGTVDRKTYRASVKTPVPISELPAIVHDFKDVRQIHYDPGGWVRNDTEP